jgi:hypothetical protein
MPLSAPRHAARMAAFGTVATSLSLMSDRQVGKVVSGAAPLGSGVGGRSAELDVDGTRVFVKRVPLTDTELRPENVRSTANLFGLPTFYQYGLGSAGFGAWRELAVHIMTTHWVLGDEYEGFPLLYHWRVLPDSPPQGFADQFGGIQGAVAHWEGSPAVRHRLEEIGRSSFSLALFLEHVPWTLATWLRDHLHDTTPKNDEASLSPRIEEDLARGATFMSSRGLVHFDAHFSNILTDGRVLYFADFGLALSSGFDLAANEAAFLSHHLRYDHYYTASQLLHHLTLNGPRGDPKTDAFLRAWIAGRQHGDIPRDIATIIDSHARPTVILNDFHRQLLTKSKRTPFPSQLN